MSLKYKYIMLHHSLTKDNKTVSWDDIRNYHTSYRVDGEIVTEYNYVKRMDKGDGKVFQPPWSDIGYNYGVELVGDYYEVFVGRPLHIPGAHCKGVMNRLAVGICFVGNYDKVEPDMEMLVVASRRIIVPLCKTFNIPAINIIGHRFVNQNKTCPGAKFPIDVLKSLVEMEL